MNCVCGLSWNGNGVCGCSCGWDDGQWRLFLRFGVAGAKLLLLFSCSSVLMSGFWSSRRRLRVRDGAGGGVYWLLLLLVRGLGPWEGKRFCFSFCLRGFVKLLWCEGAVVRWIGLSSVVLWADRDDIVERGRVFARRDCSALQAAKMLGEGTADD